MANPDNQDIEALLLHRLKNGDVDAFALVYKLYFQRLYVYCRQFTKSAYDAEDIVQEVFAKLWVTGIQLLPTARCVACCSPSPEIIL